MDPVLFLEAQATPVTSALGATSAAAMPTKRQLSHYSTCLGNSPGETCHLRVAVSEDRPQTENDWIRMQWIICSEIHIFQHIITATKELHRLPIGFQMQL